MVSFEWFYTYSKNILEFSSSVWDRAFEILIQPSIFKEMLWVLLPLIATMFVMQIYFSRYKKEEMGRSSALGNSVVLLFIGANLISYLVKHDLFYFTVKSNIALIKTIVVFFVLIASIVLIITNFLHLASKVIAYRLSSILFLNFLAIISVILVYSDIPLNYITLIASIIIFVFLCLLFEILNLVIPEHLFKEFAEIKQKHIEVETQLKQVAVEKKVAEKDEVIKKEKKLSKERRKLEKEQARMRKERAKIKNLEKDLKINGKGLKSKDNKSKK